MQNTCYNLIDTFPLASFFIDNELNILYANSLGLEKINISLEKIKTTTAISHFPEISLCIKQEGNNVSSEFVNITGQKTKATLKFASFDKKSSIGILYIIDEHTSNQKTIDEQKLNEILLDNIPADIAVFDKNYNYLYINPNGIKNDEIRNWLIGKNDFDYCEYKGLDNSIAEKRWEIFNHVLQTKKQAEWIDEYHKDGKEIYVMRKLFPLFINNEFYCMIGYGIDISELKRVQNVVISNEDRNQMILNSALDAVIIIDTNGKITFWNAQAEKIFGWKSEEVLGKLLSDIIVPDRYRKIHTEGIKNHFNGKGGKTINGIIEFPALNKKGEEFSIEFSILPIYDNGIIVNYCSFLRDITARKEKENQVELQNKTLRNKNSELEQFTYITSHDLQEPLLTLISFSDLLLEEYSEVLDDEGKLYIEFINKSAYRMRALVTGLMEYARIGKRDDIKKINCNEVVKDVLKDLSVKINNTKSVFNVKHLPIIRGHETYIRLLFQNLISNAIKFNKENIDPLVKIKCSENEHEWKFSVKDNGIGIEKENLDQVFIIFKRLNKDSLYQGYGIGLAHCKKIIDIHNGEIYVKSKLEKGSTFYFTISKKLE
ncbi:PAS domain-containing sensor histidine kinase [Flavobacterium sp.]|uniref:PAS domain-containing sensor histidine kinase n=1 Tax=Flavobacterium sp. TaxID=239 RepID=UPI004047B73C